MALPDRNPTADNDFAPDPGADAGPDADLDEVADSIVATLRPWVLEAGGILDRTELERRIRDFFAPLPTAEGGQMVEAATEAMRNARRSLILLPTPWETATRDDSPTAAYDRVADVETLAERLVLTHRLTESELSDNRLDVSLDLAIFAHVGAVHGGLHTPAGHPLRLRDHRTEAGGKAGSLRHTVSLEGPDGWLAGHSPGQLLQAKAAEGFLVLEAIDDDTAALAPEGFSAALEEVVDALNEGDGYPVGADRIQFVLAADRAAWLSAPLLPFSELVAEAGFETDGTDVGRPGSWEAQSEITDAVRRLVGYTLPKALEGDLSGLVETFDAWRAGEAPPARLAAQLHRDWPLLWPFEEEMRRRDASPDEIERFAAAVGSQSTSRPRAVGLWLAARAAALAGEPLRAEEQIEAALQADPAFPPAHEEAAANAADRGQARQAVNHLHRIRPDDDDELMRLRELARLDSPKVGRNDRCPCGSGRKFKQCHLGQSTLPEGDRVRWLLEKTRNHTLRCAPPELIRDMARAGGSRPEARPVGLDLLIFDEGWLDRFVQGRGPLLSDWERATAQRWATDHRVSVFRVDDVVADGSRCLTDASDGTSYVVAFSPALEVADQDRLVWCRLVPVGPNWYTTGVVKTTLLTERSRLLAVAASGATTAPTERLEALMTEPAGNDYDSSGEPLVECWSSFSVVGSNDSGSEDPTSALDHVLERHTGEDDLDTLEPKLFGHVSRFPRGVYHRTGLRDATGAPAEPADACEWRLTREPRGLEPPTWGRVKRTGVDRWEAQAETVADYEELWGILAKAFGEMTVLEEKWVPNRRATVIERLAQEVDALTEELDELAGGSVADESAPAGLDFGEDDLDRSEPDLDDLDDLSEEELEERRAELETETEQLQVENEKLRNVIEEIYKLWADTPARDLGYRTPRETAADEALRSDVLTMIAERFPDDSDRADLHRADLGLT